MKKFDKLNSAILNWMDFSKRCYSKVQNKIIPSII